MYSMAFAQDLRVVLLHLASVLQTLRWITSQRIEVNPQWAQDILDVDAALANRLGIWQVKWEMEDLAFRFLEPETYKQIANRLDQKRTEREQYVSELRERLRCALAEQVDRQGRVDAHEVALAAEQARVVHVAGTPQFDRRVLVEELVQPLRAEREGNHHQRPIQYRTATCAQREHGIHEPTRHEAPHHPGGKGLGQ